MNLIIYKVHKGPIGIYKVHDGSPDRSFPVLACSGIVGLTGGNLDDCENRGVAVWEVN